MMRIYHMGNTSARLVLLTALAASSILTTGSASAHFSTPNPMTRGPTSEESDISDCTYEQASRDVYLMDRAVAHPGENFGSGSDPLAIKATSGESDISACTYEQASRDVYMMDRAVAHPDEYSGSGVNRLTGQFSQ
jgi:hypothetical protein